jgi:TolB protein
MPRDDMDRLLAAWFEDDARGSAPAPMVEAAIARSAVAGRRSGRLLLTKRWPSMISTLRLRFIPSVPRPALILVLLALVLALIGAAVYAGSHQQLKPFGPARNGFLSFDSGGDIYVANADGTSRRALTSGPTTDVSPNFSPDGNLIAFGSRPTSGPDQLVVLRVSDGTQTIIDRGIAAPGAVPGPPAGLSWAPDSRRLVYVRNAQLQNGVGLFGRLAIADTATGTVVPLGDPAYDASDPAWSPDGSTIAFRRLNHEWTVGTLMLINADGTNERPAAAPASDTAAFGGPQWSPDGRFLAVYDGSYPHQIQVISLDGSPARDIGPGLGDEFFPTWSNDGSRLAWEVGQGDTTPRDLVYVANADGTGLRQLDVPDVTGSNLFWSPDDRYVFGVTSDGSSVVVVTVDGSSPVRLIPAPGGQGNGNWQRLAPCLVVC